MANTCKTCRHPNLIDIEKAMAAKTPMRHIADQFSLGLSSVKNHYRDHFKPGFEKAQAKAEAAIEKGLVGQIVRYRKEVHYSVIDKVKLLQERILNDIDREKKDRVPLYRELRGALSEEAKITGQYQKERRNETDIQRAVQGFRRFLDRYPDATLEDQREFARMWADTIDIDPNEFSKHIPEFFDLTGAGPQ